MMAMEVANALSISKTTFTTILSCSQNSQKISQRRSERAHIRQRKSFWTLSVHPLISLITKLAHVQSSFLSLMKTFMCLMWEIQELYALSLSIQLTRRSMQRLIRPAKRVSTHSLQMVSCNSQWKPHRKWKLFPLIISHRTLTSINASLTTEATYTRHRLWWRMECRPPRRNKWNKSHVHLLRTLMMRTIHLLAPTEFSQEDYQCVAHLEIVRLKWHS